MESIMNLTGKMLIAMPGMGDPRFDKSLIYICAHSDDGALGLIVNKPAIDVMMPELLKQLSIPPSDRARDVRVYFGGPVEHGRGFVLHSADYVASDATLQVDDVFGMTATVEILQDIARGQGPASSLLALGYAGWSPGQLEQEIASNGWLTCDASMELVFDRECDAKWQAALSSIGVDPLLLSATAGRA